MSYSTIHPKWDLAPSHILDGYSLEMTARDREALAEAAPLIRPGTSIAVAFLPTESMDERISTATHVRALGFEPMPHLSARRIRSSDELSTMVRRLGDAEVKRVLLVAGDPPVPEGPFSDVLTMIRTGVFEKNGVSVISIAGHPDGHPVMDERARWSALAAKISEITARGMTPLIVTQFSFDQENALTWLEDLRERGIDAPVRIGIPGPAGIKRLLRFAAVCGVGASASVLKKYGISLTKLAGTAGPEKSVHLLQDRLGPEHGRVRLHFYPFGGLKPTAEWINDYERRNGRALSKFEAAGSDPYQQRA